MPFMVITGPGPFAPEGPGDGDDGSGSAVASALAAAATDSASARATALLSQRLAEATQPASPAALSPHTQLQSGPRPPGRLDPADTAAVDLALDDDLLDSLLG
jgi:hypothetical protein